jgi:hypothetical protein
VSARANQARFPSLALASVLLLAVAAARAEDPAPPRGPLEIAEPVHDAGTVKQGVTIRHEFLLKNVGTETLSIDAKPG